MDFDEYMRTADPSYQSASNSTTPPTSAHEGPKQELLSNPDKAQDFLSSSDNQGASHASDNQDSLRSKRSGSQQTSTQAFSGDDTGDEKRSQSHLTCSLTELFARLAHTVYIFGAIQQKHYMLLAVMVGLISHLATFVLAALPLYALGICAVPGGADGFTELQTTAYLLVIAVVIRSVGGYFDQYLQHASAFASVQGLRPQLLDACEILAPHHLDGADASRALSLVTSDISQVQEVLARATSALVAAALACICADLVVAYFQPFCAVVIAVLQLVMGINQARRSLKHTHQTMLQSAFELEALNTVLLDRFQGMRDILAARACGQLSAEVDELSAKIECSRIAEQRAMVQTVRSIDLVATLGLVALALSMVGIGLLDRTLAQPLVIAALTIASYGPCMQIASSIAMMTRGLDASDRLEALLTRAREAAYSGAQGDEQGKNDVGVSSRPSSSGHQSSDAQAKAVVITGYDAMSPKTQNDANLEQPETLTEAHDGARGRLHGDVDKALASPLRDTSIDLIDLWFSYPHGSSIDLPPEIIAAMEAAAELTLPPGHPPISKKLKRDNSYVLQMVSTHIPAGAITGIKGQSGSGKSTLAQLLLGLYTPTAGILRIGGRPLDRTSAASLRRSIAYVSQDVHLFSGTLADNLRIARAQASDQALVACLNRVGLSALIDRLNDPIDTLQAFLSDGERQRIGIARCILSDRPIIIADEPTSHLDTVAEAQVLRALMELPRDATVVLISHRPSTLSICDKVCLLRDGFLFEELS